MEQAMGGSRCLAGDQVFANLLELWGGLGAATAALCLLDAMELGMDLATGLVEALLGCPPQHTIQCVRATGARSCRTNAPRAAGDALVQAVIR